MGDEHLTRVQRRQRETQERIFRVAIELFRTKGFAETTITEITAAADIGKGTFFSYFPTKEAIFGHLGQILTEGMGEAVATGLRDRQPAEVILSQLFAKAAQWHEANRPLSEQVVAAIMRGAFSMEMDRPNQEEMLQILANLVRVGQERGEFKRGHAPADVASALSGLYFVTILVWLREGDPRPLTERLERAMRLLLDGLRA